MALNPKDHAPRRRPEPPPIQFHARILGAVEYVCPFCRRFILVNHLSLRRPRVRCRQRNCHRVIEFGVLASQARGMTPPFTARYLREPANRPTLNSQEWPAYYGDPAVGQIVGPIEWWCPACSARNVGKPLQGIGTCVCGGCRKALNMGLILATPLPGAHRRTPHDWIPPIRGKNHRVGA